MKNIFCPTDFSEQSWKAVKMAFRIATIAQGNLILMHAFHMPSQEAGFNYDPETSERVRKDIDRKLDEIIDKLILLNPSSEARFKKVIKYGFAADEISSAAKATKAELIVMNTGGATGIIKRFIGSVTANVIDDAPCPLLALPNNYQGHDFNKIVYALELKGREVSNIEITMDFAKLFNAELILLNVVKEKTSVEDRAAIKFAIDSEISSLEYDKVLIEFVENNNVMDGIIDFCHKTEADMVVMAMRARGFLESIFSKSKTKELAFHSELPLLAFHKK